VDDSLSPLERAALAGTGGMAGVWVPAHTMRLCYGHAAAAMMWSILVFWAKGKEDEDGFFWLTIERARALTGMGRSAQESGIKRLKKLGLIEVEVGGSPPRRRFRLNYRAALEKLEAICAEIPAPPSDPPKAEDGDLFEEYFGSPPPPPPESSGSWQERAAERPWLGCSGGKLRGTPAASAEAQERVLWLIRSRTGLNVLNGEWKAWAVGLAKIYEAGEGDWAIIEEGIRQAWAREIQYRPSSAKGADNGFIKAVRKLAAARGDEPDARARIEYI